jgi:hypothetical protein
MAAQDAGRRARDRTGFASDADVCQMAINLARNAGYAVFPCNAQKKPARPEREGGHGFEDATTDPAQIAWFWHNWPGELIGIATGERSDLDVLDIDPGYPEAYLWWQDNLSLLPSTLTFRTRRKGLHLYFRHHKGARNTQGKLARGVDTRAEGGYCIYWFAAGFECLDHAPAQPFPAWLFAELTCQPPPPHIPAAGRNGRVRSTASCGGWKQRERANGTQSCSGAHVGSSSAAFDNAKPRHCCCRSAPASGSPTRRHAERSPARGGGPPHERPQPLGVDR